MPGSAYSDRLWAAHFPPLTLEVSSVVPTGFVWVLRDIQAFNSGVTNDSLIVTNVADQYTTFIFNSRAPGPFGESLQWTGRQVLNTGDQLQGFSLANTWNLAVSGYLLSTT